MNEEALDFSTNTYVPQAQNFITDSQRYAKDHELSVRFFSQPRELYDESLAAGRPIYRDTTYVEIRIPGDKDNVLVRVARELDKRRFARQYEFYKKGEAQSSEGTPLEQWPQIGRSMVMELKYFGVQTVEQLLTMPDTSAQNFQGINALKRSAELFLERAANVAVDAKLAAQLSERDSKISALENAILDLQKANVKAVSIEKPNGK